MKAHAFLKTTVQPFICKYIIREFLIDRLMTSHPLQASPCHTLCLGFPVLALFQTLRIELFSLPSLVWPQELLGCSDIFLPKYKQNVTVIIQKRFNLFMSEKGACAERTYLFLE